jgi:hypothetical protein
MQVFLRQIVSPVQRLAIACADGSEKNGVIAPGKAWERGMRCNDYASETFPRNPAGPNPAR